MQHRKIVLTLALSLCLFTSVSRGENIAVPDKEQRQGMSFEEYSTYREKMRTQMEHRKSDEQKSQQDSANRMNDHAEKNQPSGSYGRDYHSRTADDTRPEATQRPDFHRVERFMRNEMGRR